MRNVVIFFVLCLTAFATVSAQTSKRLSDLEKKRKAALESIEASSKQLDKNKTTTQNTLLKLNVLNQKIKKREAFLRVINNELTELDTEVTDIKSSYESLSRQLSVKKVQYAQSLRRMAKRNSSEDQLMFLFSSKDLNQMIRRMRYLNEFAEYQRKKAHEITNRQAELKEKRQALETAYSEKDAIKRKEVQEKSVLDKEKTQSASLVQSLKKKEKTLASEIQRQKKLADQLNRQIDNLIAEEAKKAAAEAAKDKNRTAPATKGGYAMTEQEKTLSGDFSKLQGRLPYPLSLAGTIVVHYGEQKFQELKYVQSSSKGIDLQTKAGADALAIYNGTITKIFSLPGYNNSIILRHGNYLSVYANLSTIFVKVGDKVKTGQRLGRIFVDEGQKTILHFQLFKDTQRLNPELWIHK